MILSCPSCATRFRVKSDALGDSGRKVRCASCSHVWMAMPEIELTETVAPEELTAPAEPEKPSEPEAPKKPHNAFRKKVETRRRNQTHAAAAGAWGGVATALAGVFVCAFLFRADIVSMWPQSSSAYASVGIEANAYGLSLDDLIVDRGVDHGLPNVTLTGAVRNIDRRERQAPALMARLFDDHGEVVLEWTVLVEGGPMAPGEIREFTTIVSDPPAQAHDVEVTLAGLAPLHSAGTTELADNSH